MKPDQIAILVVAVILSFTSIMALRQSRSDCLRYKRMVETYESYYDYPFHLLVEDYQQMDSCMTEAGRSWCDCLQYLPRTERFKWSATCQVMTPDGKVWIDHGDGDSTFVDMLTVDKTIEDGTRWTFESGEYIYVKGEFIKIR